MTRITQMASLLVALFLLTSAATAYAECAWVLWATYLTKKYEHAIERAFESQRACEDAIPGAVQEQLQVWRNLYQTTKVSPGNPAVVVAQGMADSPRKQTDGDTLIVRVTCWPLGLRPKDAVGGAERDR